jgi:hypothetical protein
MAKERFTPGGGGGKGAARRTTATLSKSRSASPLDRSKDTDATPPDSSSTNPIVAVPFHAHFSNGGAPAVTKAGLWRFPAGPFSPETEECLTHRRPGSLGAGLGRRSLLAIFQFPFWHSGDRFDLAQRLVNGVRGSRARFGDRIRFCGFRRRRAPFSTDIRDRRSCRTCPIDPRSFFEDIQKTKPKIGTSVLPEQVRMSARSTKRASHRPPLLGSADAYVKTTVPARR